MELKQRRNDKLYMVSWGLLLSADAFFLLVLLCLQLFGMPRDAGKLLCFLRKCAGSNALFVFFEKAIPLFSFMIFLLCLCLTACNWLKKKGRESAQIIRVVLFFSSLFLLGTDDEKYSFCYQILRGLLSVKGLLFVLITSVIIYVSSYLVLKQGRRSIQAIGFCILLFPFFLCFFLFGMQKGFFSVIQAYAFFALVILLSRMALSMNERKRCIFLGGMVLLMLLCGQPYQTLPKKSLFVSNRGTILLAVLDMNAVIENREGMESKEVKILGNNEGIERVLACRQDATVAYHPEWLYPGRRGKMRADEMTLLLYECANKGEDGLGLLTSYASENDYHYVVLVQTDGQEYSMVENGGYRIVYESDDMQLYYK